jgi:uncharacterized protein YndB with AHSA1/START domain
MSDETLKVTAFREQEIVMTRVFKASRNLTFEALSGPKLVKRWLLGPPGWSLPVCKIDLKVGGALRFEWRNDDGRELGMSSVYREIVAPTRIVHTELFDEDWTGGETLATNVLIDENGGTRLTVTVRYQSRAARDSALASGMERGMAASYDRLADLLDQAAAREATWKRNDA